MNLKYVSDIGRNMSVKVTSMLSRKRFRKMEVSKYYAEKVKIFLSMNLVSITTFNWELSFQHLFVNIWNSRSGQKQTLIKHSDCRLIYPFLLLYTMINKRYSRTSNNCSSPRQVVIISPVLRHSILQVTFLLSKTY